MTIIDCLLKTKIGDEITYSVRNNDPNTVIINEFFYYPKIGNYLEGMFPSFYGGRIIHPHFVKIISIKKKDK